MSICLSLRAIHVSLGGREVLRGLSLDVTAGQIRALVGLNGAGKSTALRIALGMLRPDRGEIALNGDSIWPYDPNDWRQVGHLVETPAAYPELTARENIATAATLHCADPVRAARRANQLAEALGMAHQLDAKVHRLSLGTRQKVGLISALAHDPTLVILDEPTNGLDPLAVVAFRDELRQMSTRGTTILITSHHFDELARVAGAVDVLHHGQIIRTITPDGSDLEKTFFETVLTADQQQEIAT